jgi:hypothetical protein
VVFLFSIAQTLCVAAAITIVVVLQRPVDLDANAPPISEIHAIR